MEKPKEYEVKTFDELINLLSDRTVKNLTIDVANWLMYCHALISEVKKKYPKETEYLTNSEIYKCSFIWVDDEKTDLKGVIFKNNEL